MTTQQIDKSSAILKDYAPTQLIKDELRTLERENLLKNAFIIDLQSRRRHCYDKNGNIDQDGVKGFLEYFEKFIDGANQGLDDLLDISSTVDVVCKHLDNLKL